MKRIILQCPVCKKSKLQKIPMETLIERDYFDKGIVIILIPENSICDHAFLVHVDKEFTIRDTLSIEDEKKYNQKNLVHYKSLEDMVSLLSQKALKKIIAGI